MFIYISREKPDLDQGRAKWSKWGPKLSGACVICILIGSLRSLQALEKIFWYNTEIICCHGISNSLLPHAQIGKNVQNGTLWFFRIETPFSFMLNWINTIYLGMGADLRLDILL